MTATNQTNVTIENAHLIFKNFAGKEKKFNPAGRRNFCVTLDDEMARKLEAAGWNVKYLQPREDLDEPQPYIQVSVSFDYYPPSINLISSKGTTRVDEDIVDSLDWVAYTNIDLSIRPYNWEVNGHTGVKAYLKSMYITLEEDDLYLKYSEMQEPLPWA